MEPELIADYACETGEGPLWHPEERRLYWVDIPRGELFRYNPANGAHERCYRGPGAIGGFTLQADGAIGVWRAGVVTPLIDGIAAEAEGRFNDVSATPEGRVLCGTMPTPAGPGRLYRLDTDGRLTVDAAGCIWSARWNGGVLVRYAPDGTELTRIHFPARQVSSAAFGGDDLGDLYVATAGGHDRMTNGPGAGALYRLRPGVRGLPEFRSRIAV